MVCTNKPQWSSTATTEALSKIQRALSDADRVPLIIKWGHSTEEPSRNPNMHSFLDLAPSVFAWMGLTPPKRYWHSHHAEWQGHSEVYGASDRFDEQLDRRRTIRTAAWRLVRNDFPEKPQGLELAYRQRMNTTQVIDSLAAKNSAVVHLEEEDAII